MPVDQNAASRRCAMALVVPILFQPPTSSTARRRPVATYSRLLSANARRLRTGDRHADACWPEQLSAAPDRSNQRVRDQPAPGVPGDHLQDLAAYSPAAAVDQPNTNSIDCWFRLKPACTQKPTPPLRTRGAAPARHVKVSGDRAEATALFPTDHHGSAPKALAVLMTAGPS